MKTRASSPSTVVAPATVRETVEKVAAQQSIAPELIHSVIRTESNYDPYAVSSKGALGLMQLVPATARRFGVNDVFDPVENILGGAKYLKYLLELYGGDYKLALAAYNAGEGNVSKYGGIPPFPETRNYVEAVSKRLAAQPLTPQPPAAAQPAVEPGGPNHIQEVRLADGAVRYVTQ